MFDKALLKIPGMRATFVALSLSALAQAACVIGQALALAHAIANLWAGGELAAQAPLIGLFLACFALRRVVVLVQDELLDRYATKQASNLRSRMLNAVFDERMGLPGKIGTAATATAASEDVDEVERYLRAIPPKLCAIVGTSAPVLVALFALDWVSGVIALIAFPVIVLFMVMLGRQARERAERQFRTSQVLANRFIDSLRGIGTIATLGAGQREAAQVHAASEDLRVATMRTIAVATLSSAVLDLITVFGIAAIAMMLAFRLMDGSMLLPTALAALMLAPEFFAPIRSFASDFHASLDGKNALANILGILDEVDEPPMTDVTIPHWDAQSTFEVDDLSFNYGQDGENALSHVSFSCAGFERIAIVGASGAGKSTLVDVLAGFKAPAGGSFTVNGTCHGDLCNPSWRSQVHYVPQQPHLFRATLEDNIRFYSPDAKRADVERVAHLVGLDELLNDLPEGLDTVVGEGARGLSGGQAHRVALARMLLDDRPILVFDEPTAHLDIETELELKQRMLPCMEGKLVFFATHRLHWLADMDRAIVLQDGKVAECGAPAQLLAHDGALKRFVDALNGEAVA